ncbi:phage tail protein [Clostridium botulinum]|uniref:major tail protein n=1 Tax=Clostridium botulinum TaxID=1491 RepID=UPI00016BBD9B|nr:major tail protein [Clostridium botulinum]AJD25645.1 phage major tail, phi13 family protein [Clostridium botulinum CDC_297]EPS52562.1 phage major tail protein, Phi13 family [Clostridium botulinum A1 str. CFSAN002368]AJE10074.1 phage major tail, phi13 family protein [Clostridium botulinum CDC_1436]EDT86403.1 phage major tail protein, Phi13 family [Clostridium botulinum Bf]MBY6878093.1 phage tail protein [Clostridium botulinum]
MADKVVPIVDLKKLYVAEVKEDGLISLFGEPKYFEGVKELGLKPKVNSDEFYAEGILWISNTTLANIDVEIDITDLKKEEEAFLLGHKLATEGGIIRSANDKAPEVALLYKAIKANGKARYGIMYKGTFSIGDESYKGKEGKTNYQTKKLKATFAPLHSNEMWNWKVDEEEGMTDEKFFKEVIIPTEKVETTGKAILDK